MTKQCPSKQYLSEVISNREFAEGVPPEIVIVMALQLLARMEQDPVGWQFKSVNGHWLGLIDEHGKNQAVSEGCEVRPVYAAPQLQQPPVEEETLKRIEHEANHVTAWHHIDEHSCKVNRRDLLTLVNACRAAMLQGAEPVSQRYTLRDGWVAVPVDMTPEQMRAVQRDSSLGTFASAHLSGAYDMYREFWDVAVKSVPKQEVK